MLRFLQQNGVVLGPCASELLASQAWSSWKDRAEVFRGADLREAGGGGFRRWGKPGTAKRGYAESQIH